MSGLKSAWEVSLEKSNEMNPELKSNKKLTTRQKNAIAEIRREYEARVADKEVTFDHKLQKLADRVSPDQFSAESEKLREELSIDKRRLEEEMKNQVQEVRLS